MTELERLERLEQRVLDLESDRDILREALTATLKLHEISLGLLGRDHPYAGKQIARQQEIAAEVAGMLSEDLQLASTLIQ